jgi:thioredoxin reductase (NADPH)
LSDGQLARLRAYGSPAELAVGEAAFAAGDPSYDLIVIDEGTIEVVRPATANASEVSVVRFGPGAFVGELGLLTGQTTYLTARVVERARVHRVSPPQLRRLMAEDPELSDLLLRAFLARRRRLSAGPAARVLQIIGSELDSEALALRTYAARRALPHIWLDADSVEGRSLMRAAGLTAGDLPATIAPDRTLARARPGTLARYLGLAYRKTEVVFDPCAGRRLTPRAQRVEQHRCQSFGGAVDSGGVERRGAGRERRSAGDEIRGADLNPLRDRRP